MNADEPKLQKLSWLHVRDGKVLFVRAPGAKFFFDPGCWRKPNISDEELLAAKMLKELTVTLERPMIRLDPFRFAAPALTRPERMVDMYFYMANYRGILTVTRYIEEMAMFTVRDMHRTTDMGKAILQKLRAEGLIY